MLADFMEAENGIVVNLHIQSIDHNEAIKTIKRKITDLDRMKIEEQKKAIRSGYDMDIIPSDLATYGGEAEKPFAGFAEPERANVFAYAVSFECGRHKANWTTTYFRPQVSHRNTTVCSPALTTGRNRGFCPLSHWAKT